MKQAVIVYNIAYETNPEWVEQVEAFVKAFRKVGIDLLPVLNIDAYDFIKRYKSYIKFILFWDKDLYLGEQLQQFGLPIFNPINSIRVCDDKGLTQLKLQAHQIETPKTLILPFSFGHNILNFLDRVKILLAENGFKYPFVLKQRFGSFGEQVYLITNEVMFKKILQIVGEKELLVQEFIEASAGRDYRVYVVGRKAVATVMRVNKGNFRSNVHQGGKMASVPRPNKNITNVAIKAAHACGCDFAGVDILIDERGKPLAIEVNSNARTVVAEEASRVYITYFIAKYLKKISKDRAEDLSLLK